VAIQIIRGKKNRQSSLRGLAEKPQKTKWKQSLNLYLKPRKGRWCVKKNRRSAYAVWRKNPKKTKWKQSLLLPAVLTHA
jgi:hypothetical protein